MQRSSTPASRDGIEELLDERALATRHVCRRPTSRSCARQMDEARARRLQPHYIEGAFRRRSRGSAGRSPPRAGPLRDHQRPRAACARSGQRPIATRYDRVTFDIEHVLDDGPAPSCSRPGHPLHDAVTDETIEQLGRTLNRGTVLVSATLTSRACSSASSRRSPTRPRPSVARRFGYAYVDERGTVEAAGPAPYLDCVAAPAESPSSRAPEPSLARGRRGQGDELDHRQPAPGVPRARSSRAARPSCSASATQVKRARAGEQPPRPRGDGRRRERSRRGKKAKESHASLMHKAAELDARRDERLALLDRQQRDVRQGRRASSPPRSCCRSRRSRTDDPDEDAPMHAVETKEVERRGVDLVLATERALGRKPVEQAFNNPGFDILSQRDGEDPIRIEVKARIAGAEDFFVTHNEVMTG